MSDAYKLSLSVQYASAAKNIPTRAQFRRWVKLAQQCDLQVTLRIVSEAEGRELNKAYRGKDYATNVLTFVYDDAQPRHGGVEPSGVGGDAGRLLPQSAGSASNVLQPQPLSGDIILCAPVVAREAKEQRKELLAHYAHMILHAVLHLQGYEHDDETEAAEMEQMETALMSKLRYPDPYRIL